jgi:fido (protein-threonine AMPylation protein)
MRRSQYEGGGVPYHAGRQARQPGYFGRQDFCEQARWPLCGEAYEKTVMTDYFSEHDAVLENKLGIEDPEQLKKAEAEIVFLRLVELGNEPIQGAFDLSI